MTDRPGDALAPLSVATDLELQVDGHRVAVRSTGDRLFLDVPSLRAAWAVARGLRGQRGRLDPLAATLRATDLTVEVRVREATVAVVGADAAPGELARELDLAGTDVRVGGVVAAVGREALAGLSWVARRV